MSSDFWSNMAESLRGREKALEDYHGHAVHGDAIAQLQAKVDALHARIKAAEEKGENAEEHLKEEIKDEHGTLSVEIDAFVKQIKD